ncbi:MAG: Lrp/AsnC family transcriptional regulator [Candidatus Lokiarchaeota archaeon]|nr:Lrp/AsnC family transcriptional regulator [Candidatus Lokiarchaeota archaeon]
MIESKKTIIDDLDKKILKTLTKDGAISHRQIAKDLERSPVTISKHIKELEGKSIIEGYTININYENLGYDIIALIELTISKGMMLDVEKDIARHPNIFAVYDITGNYDAIILSRFKTRTELSDLLKMINSYDYVVRTNTHIILNTIKEGTDFRKLIDLEK